MVESKRIKISEPETIGWSRSFTLALKAVIVGFLLGFVWVAIHTIISYSLLATYWFTPDFGQMLLDDFVGLFFPFMPFPLTKSYVSPIFGLFGFSYNILSSVLTILFLFIVYVSQLVPLVKYSFEEAGHSISWKRGYIVGLKAGIVGLVLEIIFVFIGLMITLPLMFATFPSSSGAPPPGEYNPSMIVGQFIVIVFILVVLLFFAEAATGAAVIKYTTTEARLGGIGWIRSFSVAIKAGIVGFLWAILFGLIFAMFFGIILIAALGSLSSSALAAGAFLTIVMLFITVVLVYLAPTACIIKYLTEEILNIPNKTWKRS